MVARAEVDGAPIEQTRTFRIDPAPRRAIEAPPVIPAPVDRPRPFEVHLPESVRPGTPALAEVTGPWDDATVVPRRTSTADVCTSSSKLGSRGSATKNDAEVSSPRTVAETV